MQTTFKMAGGICAFLIYGVYPFAAAWRGRPVTEVVVISWAVQMIYFTSLCFGIPSIGYCFSRELGDAIYELAPDARILVATLMIGWLAPLIFGSVGDSIRPLPKPSSLPDV